MWSAPGQNHLPPRGDITDLVNTPPPARKNDGVGKMDEGERGGEGEGEGEVVKSKQPQERLSNGFSSHADEKNRAELLKEEEEEEEVMEVESHREGARIVNGGGGGLSTTSGVVGGGATAMEGESRGAEGTEGVTRNSQRSPDDDELRQSVGSVTSSEFNPNVFGAVRDGEEDMMVVQEGGGGGGRLAGRGRR